MSQIIIRAVIGDVPAVAHPEISTSISLSFLQLVPLAVVFWGHSSLYSQEMQKKIPLRMQLFGFSQGTQMLGRMISLMIFFTAGIIINLGVFSLTLDLATPTLKGFFLTILIYYLLGVILFMLAPCSFR